MTRDAKIQELYGLFSGCLEYLEKDDQLSRDKAWLFLNHLFCYKIMEKRLEIQDKDWAHRYCKDDEMKISEFTSVKEVIGILNAVDFSDYDDHVLGGVYEELFIDTIRCAGSKEKLRLVYTPPIIRKLLVNLVNPTLKSSGKIESVFDPACGTGGVLSTVIHHYRKYETNNQMTEGELDDQIIENIFGIEWDAKVLNLCWLNLSIYAGLGQSLFFGGGDLPGLFDRVIPGGTLRKSHCALVDIVLADLPCAYGSREHYAKFFASIGGRDDYLPIKTGGKNLDLSFIQMVIHNLIIGGRSAMLLNMESLSSKIYSDVRQYLLKSCDLHEVIALPANFRTPSPTCIIYFTKRKRRQDVVKIGIENDRIISFTDKYSTKKVKFFDFNPQTETKNFIKEVLIEEIALNDHCLNHISYLEG